MQMTWQVKQVYPTLAWQPLNRKKWGIILFDLSAAGVGAALASLSKNYSPAATTHAGYYNQSAKRLAQGLQIFWPWLLSSRTFRPLLFLFGLALILGNFLGYLPSFYLDIWLLWILHTCFFVYKEYFLFSSWSKLWYLDFACSYNVLYTMQCCYTTIISCMQLLRKNSEKRVGQCSQCSAISILCFNFYEGLNHSYLPQ